MKKLLTIFVSAVGIAPLMAQTPTSFVKVGDGDEKTQEFFPGEHRARPVLGDYTNSGRMGLFSGGQDLGGSTGWYNDSRWGDLGDGTFANPVLNADYSDPDVIRVGDKYYMTCSEFHFMGMPILESDDMVNWHIIARVHDKINLPGFSDMQKYGGGTWAPALRYHDGKFWIYVCMPHEGLFVTTATDPAGEWSELYQVKDIYGWEDPCPLWDDNGEAFLGRSQLGGGPIYIHKMSADGKTLLDEGKKIYEGPTAEGTKLFKKDGYYYLSIPEGGVGTGWQTVLRSKDIYGPYEGKRVLETGSTNINGPHQGALVDTPDGEWWFYHFQSTPVLGRVTHLQPVKWVDGFPMIGEDYDMNGIGEPMKVCQKPNTGVNNTPFAPQTSDDFDSNSLGIQWQFNHNPVMENITFSDGWLNLASMKADKLKDSKNQLTQKLMGFTGSVVTLLDCNHMKMGDCAGIESGGSKHLGVGVTISNVSGTPVKYLYIDNNGSFENKKVLPMSAEGKVYLMYEYDTFTNQHIFSYSVDGKDFKTLGNPYENGEGDWKGVRTGLYNYNVLAGDEYPCGKASFDFFEYLTDGPASVTAK